MSPKVRRVVRSVKYFFVFIILAAVVLCIVTLLSGESVVKLFMPMSEGGMLKEGQGRRMVADASDIRGNSSRLSGSYLC